MMVAVVGETQEQAIGVIARLGMVLNARALRIGQSPLLGTRFTAVLVACSPETLLLDDLSNLDWWDELQTRNSGPTYTLGEWPE